MADNQHVKSVEFSDTGSITRIEFYQSYMTATELATFINEYIDVRFPLVTKKVDKLSEAHYGATKKMLEDAGYQS